MGDPVEESEKQPANICENSEKLKSDLKTDDTGHRQVSIIENSAKEEDKPEESKSEEKPE